MTAAPSLKIYNTLTRKKQMFMPRKSPNVKIFTCGPSIYGIPHIGNYRTFLYEDILHRYLEYLGYRVDRLINFTDVEDKAIEHSGKSMEKMRIVTENAADNFFKNCGLLHIKMPDFIPRSSTSIDQSVQLIKQLMHKKIAYRLDDDIFYDPLKFKGFGRLFGLDMSRWPKKKRRYRKDNYPGNRWNRGDFILWHGFDRKRDGDIFWETELGKGRPAWNIQDPAMITGHFGFQIDIACGGIDNIYRHHDYSIAVIEGVSGTDFAKYWMHGEHVLLDGGKMSKSKGNIVYPQDLRDRKNSAAAIRFFLMHTHYRKKLNLTDRVLFECREKCHTIQTLARRIFEPPQGNKAEEPDAEKLIQCLVDDFENNMDDDLQVGPACDGLVKHLEKLVEIHKKNGLSKKQWNRIGEKLLHIDSVLQVLYE
ncbi:MAG: class I tRNA ligase family protein [Desulfobulbaceae bacterium]|nr:class I tRNA ligase family protein [Desulfobulbaceae bacterium]